MNKSTKIFSDVKSKTDFIQLEHDILNFWDNNNVFKKLIQKNKNGKPWSFMDGPITANNPMGVHHAWGRTLKDVFQRYHSMQGYELRYQNGFDCQGLWVEIEVEKELGFKTKLEVQEYGMEKFVNKCKERVKKYSSIQTEQSKRLGYWMDWENSYFTMSDENNYTIWSFLKKLFKEGKIYKGNDVVPWSGRSGTSYSQMEIIEGRKLVAHTSVFVKFRLLNRKNEYLLIWTTTPWTLTSNVAAAVNINLDYLKLEDSSGDIFYFAKENFKFKRLDKQFKEKKNWIDNVPKLKTIEQIFKEKGGYNIVSTIKGKDMLGWKYEGPFDHLEPQNIKGGYPKNNSKLNVTSISCHKIIDGGKDSIGNDIVVAGEGTGIVHIAPGCGAIDNKIAKKEDLVIVAPLNEESCYLDVFGKYAGKVATSIETTNMIIGDLKDSNLLLYKEQYPHIYPHCWRSGDELVFRIVDEWYINMDWRKQIKDIVKDAKWIPEWGYEREMEWLDNMGDWMISKKRFWGLALPIWEFEDGTFYVVGSKEELKELSVEGWDDFEKHSPHRPWIDKVKIKHPDTGLIGTRIPDVGNPWLDAGIVPYSTLNYSSDKNYWNKWFPADFVVECFPGQFRNWFYSLLALSTKMENKAPFKTLLGHALVKDENGKDMHKSWGNAIWFDDAAEKMGVDVMRWMYSSQNPEQNLLFGYSIADDVRKQIITLWNTYSFFVTYANIDGYNPSDSIDLSKLTKIDKWILSKINVLIDISIKYYENYQVYLLMKHANQFLDNLSNWYVRRNRRRFWKSENDSNKSAAYFTLYTVLLNFIKIMSPIIPFITESIYKNLTSSISNSPESIHLTSFPKSDKKLVNKDLQDEIDTMILIVSMARSARNKANIKIRQPLSELVIYSNSNTVDVVKKNSKEILEELNIKTIRYVDYVSSLVNFNVSLNYQRVKEKYPNDINFIIKYIKSFDDSKLYDAIINSKEFVIINDDNKIKLSPSDFIIKEIPTKNFIVVSDNNTIVGINTIISKELKCEGIVRDLIRQVQNLRKDSALEVEDRINVGVNCSKTILEALFIHEEYFKNEVLGIYLNKDNETYQYTNSVKINGELVEISISVQN